jgi:hypothetical protein
VNTVEAILDDDAEHKKVVFTATSADYVYPTDTIMIVTDISIGAANLAQSGNLSAGTLYIDPELAALMPVGKKFKVQKTDGTLSPELTVTSTPVELAGGVIKFTGGSGPYTRDDYIVFPVKYADLKGAVSWDHSMAGGAEKALGPGSFISGFGKTAAEVLEDDFTPKPPLIDKGNNDFYPTTASNDDAIEALLDRCFEQYVDNGGVVNDQDFDLRGRLRNLFKNNLFTWDGSDLSLPDGLGGPVSITDFLNKDANSRPRISGGVIDVGAYEN